MGETGRGKEQDVYVVRTLFNKLFILPDGVKNEGYEDEQEN